MKALRVRLLVIICRENNMTFNPRLTIGGKNAGGFGAYIFFIFDQEGFTRLFFLLL